MNDYIKSEIENIISEFQQLPFLFVGTGLSMRYAHAPSWNELLYDIWKIVNPSKKERDYEKLRQGIEMDVNSKFSGLTSDEYSNVSEPPFYRLRATSDFNTLEPPQTQDIVMEP